jgi:toxin HigB-1
MLIIFIFVMEIHFENLKLKELANDERKAIQKLGKLRAKIFYKRLELLYFADTPEDLKFLPGNFHQLKYSRLGQWACDLSHPYRLVFEVYCFPKQNNFNNGGKIADLCRVQIIEIIDYH